MPGTTGPHDDLFRESMAIPKFHICVPEPPFLVEVAGGGVMKVEKN